MPRLLSRLPMTRHPRATMLILPIALVGTALFGRLFVQDVLLEALVGIVCGLLGAATIVALATVSACFPAAPKAAAIAADLAALDALEPLRTADPR